MASHSAKTPITIDGSLSDWTTSDLINFGDGTGYSIFARAQDGIFDFGISGPLVIGANTTAWFNTDLNTATGFQIFGYAGGAEFNLNIKADGTAALYSGGSGQTLVLDNIQLAYSADHQSVEFAIPDAALGNPAAIDMLYDINDSVFLPDQFYLPALRGLRRRRDAHGPDPPDRHRLFRDDSGQLLLRDGVFGSVHGGAKPGHAGRHPLRPADREPI